MSRLHALLSFFALPMEQQIQLLPEIPYDRGAPDYYADLRHNPLRLLALGVSQEDTQLESESNTDCLARTGLHSDCKYAVLSELSCYVYLLCHHYDADDYWTQRELVGKIEWRLFRRLASLALTEIGWQIACAGQDVRVSIGHFKKEFAHA